MSTDRNPVRAGHVVPYGWKGLFARTIVEVGGAVSYAGDWYTLVRYASGTYALVRYSDYAQGDLSIAAYTAFRSDDHVIDGLIKRAAEMPKIIDDPDPDMLRLRVTHSADYKPEPLADLLLFGFGCGLGGVITPPRTYELRIYGVKGEKRGRRDTYTLLPGT